MSSTYTQDAIRSVCMYAYMYVNFTWSITLARVAMQWIALPSHYIHLLPRLCAVQYLGMHWAVGLHPSLAPFVPQSLRAWQRSSSHRQPACAVSHCKQVKSTDDDKVPQAGRCLYHLLASHSKIYSKRDHIIIKKSRRNEGNCSLRGGVEPGSR